ncbi:MAG: hypothetical protein EDM03_02455 [Porphyrobacter sp. IPPAS B-1204]|nr:MAG: hypothetical protein EDM03_02455 [Porphyrobacter sp. IPPAS B-1204]
MALTFRAFALASALAGTTLFAVPAAAAPLNTSTPSAITLGAPSTAFDYSRYDPASAVGEWRRCRWGCGWGGGWGHRGWRRNRVGAGDVLIGAAIIGGIAAIASSNNRRQRERDVVIVERDVRDADWRDDNRRYDDRRIDDRRTATPRGTGASGLDNAVSQCLDRIERDVRVDSVENVERTGAGWRVSGVLFNGSPFQCRIGNGGQIDGIDYGDGFRDVGFSAAPASRADDGQWDDQRYASARASVGGTVRPDMAVQEAMMTTTSAPVRTAAANTAMPAYPGGPIPGEVIPETVDIER